MIFNIWSSCLLTFISLINVCFHKSNHPVDAVVVELELLQLACVTRPTTNAAFVKFHAIKFSITADESTGSWILISRFIFFSNIMISLIVLEGNISEKWVRAYLWHLIMANNKCCYWLIFAQTKNFKGISSWKIHINN